MIDEFPKYRLCQRVKMADNEEALKRIDAHSKVCLSDKQLELLHGVDFAEYGLDAGIAGAGAGKTRCLSYITLKALANPRINRVYILTATRTAKDEAFARVNALYDELDLSEFGVRRLSPMTVKTTHAFGLQAARYANEQSGGTGVQIVHKATICDIIKQNLDKILEEEHSKFDSNDICFGLPPKHAVDMLYNVRGERMKQMMEIVDDSMGLVSAEVLKRVISDMLRHEASGGQRLVDFDEVVRNLADSEIPIIFENDLLIVDEAQDFNKCQMRTILNCLRAGNRNVLVLGDDSQGIFQFTGAVFNTLKTIIEECSAFGSRHTIYKLFQNHRSTNQIVAASELLLPKEDRSSRVNVKGNGDGAPVEVCVFKSNDIEARGIAQKAISLVSEKKYDVSDFVFLRHSNWAFNDPLVGALRAEASKQGVNFPIVILGQNTNSTISMKLVSIIQVAAGSEVFCTDESSGIDLLRVFTKSVRCTKGTPPLTMKVFETVWSISKGDIATMFMRRQPELLECFKRLLKNEEDAALERADTNNPQKRQKSDGTSQKEKNFLETIRVLSKTCQLVRKRMENIVENKLPLAPLNLEPFSSFDGKPVGQQAKKAPRDDTRPSFDTPIGGLCWIVVRDLVDHSFEGSNGLKFDAQVDEIASAVSQLDIALVPRTEQHVSFLERITATIESQVSNMLGKLHDKETTGKAILSTAHKFKGRERPVGIVSGLREPYVRIEDSRRAALGLLHEKGCYNTTGNKSCMCRMYTARLTEMRTGDEAEKRRLFYVAASRAKEKLFLTASYANHPLNALEIIAPGCQGIWAEI